MLQIHDEVILDGPSKHAAEAMAIVKDVMEHPFGEHWSPCVDLNVDAHLVQRWGDAK